MSQALEFDAPCCSSIRECAERRLVVIGFKGSPKILREIKATRCARGVTKKVKFFPSNDVILIEYYRSNRGVNYITILWKPENVTNELEIVRKALGLSTEETIRIL
jgi:hypothetical protein